MGLMVINLLKEKDNEGPVLMCRVDAPDLATQNRETQKRIRSQTEANNLTGGGNLHIENDSKVIMT